MVSAHIHDLLAAAGQVMATVYVVRCPSEDRDRQDIKDKSEGGEVDYVVNSLTELAELFT